MYDQSITGIRSNLDVFSQAAARIAKPQATEDILAQEDAHSAARGNLPRLSVTAAKGRKVAADQTTLTADQSAKAQVTYRKATNLSGSVQEPTPIAETTGKAKKSANEPASRQGASTPVDEAQEVVKMMIAQKGVEANIGALKSAQSLSSHVVDIKA